jgi:hypothetical protein
MAIQPPPSNDPLAALAKSAARAVQEADAELAAKVAARDADKIRGRKFFRTGWQLAVIAGLLVVVLKLLPRVGDPYYGVDPLADPQQAKAYVTGLLDAVEGWRARHGGVLPDSLEVAVAQIRMLPADSAYRLEYKVEGHVPVITLHGGKEPVVVRGH